MKMTTVSSQGRGVQMAHIGHTANYHIPETAIHPGISRKKAALIFFFFLLFFTLVYPARDTNAQSVPASQIESTVLKTEYKLNEKTRSVIFSVDTELTNHSDIGIMDVKYRITFYDNDGNEMDSAFGHYNGQDTPVRQEESAVSHRAGQFTAENKPGSVSVEVLEVKTESEMPPVYLPKPGDYLYQALRDKNLENIREEPPVRIEMWIDHGGPRDEGIYTDPETIAQFVDAFTQVTIAAESDISVTDNYNGFAMSFANGEFYVVRLNLMNLEYNVYGTEHIYELDHFESFWRLMKTLTFPANNDETDRAGGS